MKIMQIISGAAVNGAITHCLLLTRELARRGHDVTLVCRPGAWIGEQLASDPVKVIHSDQHRWPGDELRRIAKVLDDGCFDVIHTHMSRAHLFGVLLRLFTRVPRVASAHCRHIQPHWALNDMVITASESTRRFHRRVNFVPGHRIVKIHNFVDGKRFENLAPETRHTIRRPLGIADSDLLITVVANVMPRKGQRYAIAALPQILAATPSARLLLVGDEDQAYTKLVQSEADRLNVSPHIHWLGRRDDIPNLLGASDLFLLPSLEETMPLAILEAMAAGLPTVATNVGGVAECISQGETGLLVPRHNHRALGEAVIELLSDSEKRRRMGKAARRRYEESFSIESQTAATEAVFEQMVSRQRARRAA